MPIPLGVLGSPYGGRNWSRILGSRQGVGSRAKKNTFMPGNL